MIDLDRLEREIAIDEGFRGSPYLDSVGVLTVGYGRNLESNPLTADEARYLMLNDVIACIRDLESFEFWQQATTPRRHALINMRYNLGAGGFREFRRMIAAANRGDWQAAADEAQDSKWFRQVKSRGPKIVNVLRTGEHRD